MPRLDYNLEQITNMSLPNIELEFALERPDRLLPKNGNPGKFVPDTPIIGRTGDDSSGHVDLIATTDYVNRTRYRVTIPGWGSFFFTMPTTNADLYTRSTMSSELPARSLPDPNAIPDGTVPISINNEWTPFTLIITATSAPAAPPDGVNALWFNTSTNPYTEHYYNHTTNAWVEAKPPPGQIDTTELADGSVTNPKLEADAVTNEKLADNAVRTENIMDDAIDDAKIAPAGVDSLAIAGDAVTTPKIADNAVTTPKIADGNVTHSKLATNAVETDNIANTAITTDKLGARVVGTGNIDANAIIEPLISDGAIGTAKIQDQAVTAAKLAPGVITDTHLASNSVGTDELVDGAVTHPKLAANAVETDNIANAQVTNPKIADDAIGTSEIVDGAVTEDKIANGAVTSVKLGNDVVTGTHVAPNSIGTTELEDGAVTNPKLANTSITNQKLDGGIIDHRVMAINAIETENIADGNVTHPKLATDAVEQDNIASGAVGIGELHADASDRLVATGGDTGEYYVKQSSADGDGDWGPGPSTPASWAVQGNEDDIPRSKLPPSAHASYTKEHSSAITVANLGPANEGRGFDRVSSGGGGSATDASLTVEGVSLELIAAEQLTASGLISVSYSIPTGNIPANFRDRYIVIEDSDGFHDVLRIRDATRFVLEPNDTNYPAGLRRYIAIEWNAQNLGIIYNRTPGSTFTLSLAIENDEYIEDFVAPWAQTGNNDAAPVGKIPVLDSSKLGADSVNTAAIQDDAVTNAKIADGAVDEDKLANNAVNTNEIRNSAVTGSKLDSNSVSTDKITDASITTAKIVDDAVTEAKLANAIVARLNPMGGAGGQSGSNPPSQTINLWTRRTSTPAVSELSTVTFDGTNFGGVPSNWHNSPADATGSDPLYEATAYAQWNSVMTNYTIGTWAIHASAITNTQFSPNPNAMPPTITSAPTSASRWHRRRDPDNGNRWGIWLPLYVGESTWTNLVSIDLNRTSRTQNTTHNFPASFHGPSVRLLGVVVDCKHPPSNQTEWVDWDQISDYFLWPVNTGHTSELYNQPTAQFTVKGTSDGGLKLYSSAVALDDIPAASTSAFQWKFMLRGNASTGYISQVYVYRSGATGQAGSLTLRYL